MNAELPKGFPELVGCPKHNPRAVELRRWNEPLADDHWSRITFASGLSWSVAFDRTDNEAPVTIIDCSWAANGLQAIGVDLAKTPLVAIQTWDNTISLDDIAGCDGCMNRLDRLDSVLINHWSDVEDVAFGDELDPFPHVKWSNPPESIADAVVNDLRQRSILGEAMTVLEGTAGWDLLPKAPVFVQFLFSLLGELQIQVRKDFAYWDVMVDEPRVTRFSAAGFSVDGPFFEMLLGPDPHDLFHRDAITTAVRASVDIFETRGRRIRVRRVEGVSHIEGRLSEAKYAEGQRRIDRTTWAEMLEKSDQRIEELGDGDLLFDVLEVEHPVFARLVALAHLDEYFARMDDLQVLIPDDALAYLSDVESDPFASPEQIASFVLRHCFRWNDQRAYSAGENADERNPDLLSIETLAHETFIGRLSDGELVEIGGRRIEPPRNDTCMNGSFAQLSGRLEPPGPPQLIAPNFD